MKLKKLSEQVVVITGASSGIGLCTARRAAKSGARLVLAARNEDALKQLAAQLADSGSDAAYVVADVGKEQDVRDIARVAIERFGRFDTWVNNAGVSIYGPIEEVSLEDARRLFDTNFWGVVHGSLVAIEHLKRSGGALINLGSEVSDVAVPLQGYYSASKHAVKGFTNALRLELEEQGAPVSVTLIKPAAIDSMFVEHAKNYLEVEPKLPPPLYAPEVVAEAILQAAQHPQREIFVGGAAKFLSSAAHYLPRTMDKYLRKAMFRRQRTDRPARNRDWNGLHAPGAGLRERQGQDAHVRTTSVYTAAATHPRTSAAVVVGAGVAAALLWKALKPPKRFLGM
jgi:short-subunit dehydrogenase